MENNKETLGMLNSKLGNIKQINDNLENEIDSINKKNENIRNDIEEYNNIMKRYNKINIFNTLCTIGIGIALFVLGIKGHFNLASNNMLVPWFLSLFLAPGVYAASSIFSTSEYFKVKYNFKDRNDFNFRDKNLEKEIEKNNALIKEMEDKIKYNNGLSSEVENIIDYIDDNNNTKKEEKNNDINEELNLSDEILLKKKIR